MILDTIQHINRYEKLFPEVIVFIHANDLYSLPDGKYVISDDVLALVMNYTTTEFKDTILENHYRNIDFHLVLGGNERVGFSNSFDKIIKSYNEKEDFELVSTQADLIKMEANQFIVIYPGEYHKPGIIYQDIEVVKKVVFKIKIG